MSQEIIALNNQTIILTTGVYDLVKEHVRRKKVTPIEEEILKLQLKKAMQVPRKSLPSNVITIDTRVTIKDQTSNQTEIFIFVAPDKAKKKNKTESILTPMGLALVGCKEGDVITWAFEDGVKQIEILNVERLS
jgi:regulator of nucleoside diphosphate kinase